MGLNMRDFISDVANINNRVAIKDAEFEIVKQIKQERCYMQASREVKDIVPVKHQLPDGTEIAIQNEMVEAPELLFDPSVYGFEAPSVVQTVADCVKACDIDLRKQLFESVFLAGGSTQVPGFCDRFLPALARVTPRSCTVRVHAPQDRHLTAWTGASFLAQLSGFREMLTSKADYNEHGKERLLHSRLFA